MGIFRTLATTAVTMGAATLIGCDNSPNHDKMPSGDQGDSARELVLQRLAGSPSEIDFAVVTEIFEQNRCLHCHNSKTKKDNVNLADYEALLGLNGLGKKVVETRNPQDSSLFQVLRASGQRQMPPALSPRLSENEQMIVFHWINEGAPREAENQSDHGDGGSNEPVDVPIHISEELAPYLQNPETIDFEVVDNYVFATSCNDCHSSNGSKPDFDAQSSFDLTSYRSLFFSTFGVPFKKGKPYSTGAYQVVAFDQSMPPTKQGYRLLSPYRAKLLRLWILNCAIEEFTEGEEPDLLKRGDKRRICEGEM
jgi:hypothetical protein